MNLYLKLKDISALIFHEIKFTGVILLLDKDYEEDKAYTTVEIITINEAWLNLYDEYYQKSDDTRLRRELKNHKVTLKLLIEINILKVVIQVLELMQEHEGYVPEGIVFNTLNSFKNTLSELNKIIKFDISDGLETNIKNVTSYYLAIKTRYDLLFKKDMNVDAHDLLLYYKIKSNIEAILKKDHIPDYINMLQWITYEIQVRLKIKHGRQHDSRFGRNKTTH